MNTRISTKIVAIAVAMLVNSAVFGGIALLFSAEPAAAAVAALVTA